MIPQWSVLQQLNDQQGKRIQVHYFGNSTSEAGDVWVDAQDVGPIGKPPHTNEPEWPHPSPPATEPVHISSTYHPPTAPEIPADHIPFLVAAARSAQVDVGILAGTAARESGFDARAYREEPGLKYVRWRHSGDKALDRFPDGSLGPCQILRSNFLGYGIDNDADGFSPEHNYRTAALIIRDNFVAFPDDHWKAVAAYNVGQYGAKLGRIPAGGYVDTIFRWAEEYRKLFQPDLAPSTGGTTGNVPPNPSQEASIGQTLVQYGMTLLGTPYVFGGKYIPRDKGIDCSGFVCEVFAHCGIDLGNRDYLSAEAIRQTTRSIQEAEAITGDLIFFKNTYDTPGASHIGIWIADGKIIDAHGTHVQLTDTRSQYWQEHLLALGRLPYFDQLPPSPPVPAPISHPEPPDSILHQAPEADACSFCGKASSEVQRLISSAGDTATAICDECIKLYADLIGHSLPV
jgi:cell wall-associated NlpC family hydrolase